MRRLLLICALPFSLLIFSPSISHAQEADPPVSELCIDFESDPPLCISLKDLRQQLNPEVYAAILETILAFEERAGLDTRRDSYIHCDMNEFGATNIVDAVEVDAEYVDGNINGMLEFLGYFSGCTQNASLGSFGDDSSVASVRGQYNEWVYQSVNEFEQDIVNCENADKHRNLLADSGGSSNETHHTDNSDTDTVRKNEKVSKGVIARNKGMSEMRTDSSTDQPSTFNEAIFKLGGHEKQPNYEVRLEKLPPRNTPVPITPDPDGGASCEERKRAWNLFKTFCDASEWQAYHCVQFLRKLNGCVDITLINPGPDGDLTCPTNAQRDSEERAAWTRACKLREGIIIPAPDGTLICPSQDDFDNIASALAENKFDICNSPNARPAPGQCPEVVIDAVDDTPRPVPLPTDMKVFKPKLIKDVLEMDISR